MEMNTSDNIEVTLLSGVSCVKAFEPHELAASKTWGLFNKRKEQKEQKSVS